MIGKYIIGLKSLQQQGILEPVLYDDLGNNLKILFENLIIVINL